MHNDDIDIYYFSGTGNTLLAIDALVAVLREHGKNVTINQIEKSDPEAIDLSHCIGLAFPVAAFSTYPFVWDFINALPNCYRTEIFMLDTLAAFSGGIVGPLKRTLQKKGYIPIGAAEFIMPSNYGRLATDESAAKKIEVSMEKVRHYANDLVLGKTQWKRIPIFSDVLRFLSKMKMPWRLMGSMIRIDKSRCKRCGLCEKICPVHNIEMQTYPIKKENCVSCMRCVAFCPYQAIRRNKKIPNQYQAVSVERFL